MAYHHEQIGKVFVGLGLLLIVPFALGIAVRSPFVVWFVVAFALVYWAFARLNIDVDAGTHRLQWCMTFGWPRACIPLADVATADIVPVTFWMGIGIHFTLRGWVWNVALGTGVRIVKRDGSDVILGTDDPHALLAAIERAR